MRIILVVVLAITFQNIAGQISTIPTSYTEIDNAKYYPAGDGGYVKFIKTDKMIRGKTWNRFRCDISLLRLDKDMKIIKQQSVSNGEAGFSSYYADIKENANKLWLVYLDPGSGNNIGSLKASLIDCENLSLSEPKTIADEKLIDEQLKLFMGPSSFMIRLESSPNKKFHFLLIATGREKFFVCCLNEKLETVWNSKEALPNARQQDINSIVIGDDGKTYISSANQSGGFVSVYDKEGKPTHQKLAFGEEKLNDIQLVLSKASKKLMAVGTYMANSDYCTGVFKAELNKQTIVLEQTQKTPFPDSIIQRLKKDGFASTKSKNFGIRPMYLTSKVFEQGDGTLNLLSELKQQLGSGEAGPMVFGVGSLLNANFNSTTATFSHIPRYAVVNFSAREDQYYAIACNGSLSVFYIDNAENLQRDLNQEQKVLKGNNNAILTGAFIANDGTVKRQAIPVNLFLGLSGSIYSFAKKECQN